MVRRLLESIGVRSELIEHLDQAQLVFDRPWVFWLGLLLAIPFGFWVASRQQFIKQTSKRLFNWLVALRVLLFLLVAWILAGPNLRLDLQLNRKPIVAVLLDQSRSMNLSVGQFEDESTSADRLRAAGLLEEGQSPSPAKDKQLADMTRLDVIKTLTKRSALWDELLKKFDLRFYGLADSIMPMPADDGKKISELPLTADGDGSRISDGVAQVFDASAGAKVAGIVVVSDGRQTAGRPVLDAGSQASKASVPIYTMPVGSRATQPDVAVVDIFTAGRVFLGDQARIGVTIESSGLEDRTVPVQLLDGEQVVDQKEIVLHGAEQQHVELAFAPKSAGSKFLTVNIPVQKEEPTTLHSNNREPTYLLVTDEKRKVLYLDGQPRWDFQFLKTALQRDNSLAGIVNEKEPDVYLETRWRLAKDSIKLPNWTAEELGKYHLIILGDASAELVPINAQKAIAEAVEKHGVGLVVASGPKSVPRKLAPELQAVLPIEVDQQAEDLSALVYKPFSVELTPDGSQHVLMRLFDNIEQNDQTWRKLPSFFWQTNVLRTKPAAVTLLANSQASNKFGKMPVISYQTVGLGKSMFIATDSTWLWRRNVGDRYFYKFWGQAIHFMARREDATKTQLYATPVLARIKEPTRLELFAYSADKKPADEATLKVDIADGKSTTTLELERDPSTPGRYTGNYLPTKVGSTTLSFSHDKFGQAESKLEVRDDSIEFRRTSVHRPTLETLAASSGGKLLEFWEVDQLKELLQGEPKVISLRRESTLWDNWLTLALLALIYCIDIAARRLSGLA